MSARPFTESEYALLSQYFTAEKRTRDRLYLVLSAATGFRVTEITNLTVGQVWNGTEVRRELTIARRAMKGGRGTHKRSVRSRRVPLSDSVRAVIAEHLGKIGTDPALALFATGRSNGKGMSRSQAFRIITEAAAACGIDTTRISCHSTRKLFARRVYEASGRSLICLQRIIGHQSPMTSALYLEEDEADLDRVVLNLCA